MMPFLLIKLNVPNVEGQEILKHMKIQEELVQFVLAKAILNFKNSENLEVKIEGNGENEVREKIDLLCDRLFANTVIEDYEYSLEKL